MPAWFGRKREVTPTIDSLSFDTSGWKYHGERQSNAMRLWEASDGDAVILHFFGMPPDIPAVRTLDELSSFYAEGLKPAGGKVVECGLASVAGCHAIRLLLKVPQKPSGMMYQGVFTVPFRDFSYVIRIQCPELGTTGLREAILFEQRLKAGEQPNVGGSGPPFAGWNPDAPEYDDRFPKHPVSRLRRLLAHVARTATMDAGVRALPGFQLPTVARQ